MSVRLLCHVPRSQVWEGSRGKQSGHVHIHLDGRALCGRRGWYEREPYPSETLCPRCEAKARKLPPDECAEVGLALVDFPPAGFDWSIVVEPDPPALYVVYAGTSRVSQHETLEGARDWIAAHEPPRGVYGKWCRDPKACAGLGYCPREPTCAD